MIAGHLPELIVVLVLGLVFFGPKRLPELGEAMGKGIHSFKKGVSDMESDHASHDVPVTAEISTRPAATPFVVDDITDHQPANEVHATHTR